MSTARFIIGTGRCGSTLLSRMLEHHTGVLSLSEFYAGLDWNTRLQEAAMSGSEFRELITAPHPILTMVLERGYLPPEFTYPFERPGVRFAADKPLPYMLAHTLPPLSEDPDGLLDAVSQIATAQPEQPPARHAEDLFAWLCGRFDRQVWVERSASSIIFVDDLARAFPGAKFLHIHRRGEDAALSMREHPVFRLAVMLTYGLAVGEGGTLDQFQAASENADHISQLLATRAPAEYFGRWWSEQLTRGYRGLTLLDAAQYQEVRFEDLLKEPEETLTEIADFLELPDPKGGWRSTAAGIVGEAAADPLEDLSSDEAERLTEACRPGNELLGRA